MTPLSQHRGCIVFWVTFPDGWHMLICFPAAISLFFTVRWSALMIPAVSLQRIPGYQQSNVQRLLPETQLYPIWKNTATPHTQQHKTECGADVNKWKINKDEKKCIDRSHLILPISLKIANCRVVFLTHWHCHQYVKKLAVVQCSLRRGNLKSLCHFR